VSTTDGRVFIGTFAGTDKPLNIILVNTEEFLVGPGQNPDGRYVGQVVLPWKVVVKVEAHIADEKPERGASSDGMYIWWVFLASHHVPAECFSDPYRGTVLSTICTILYQPILFGKALTTESVVRSHNRNGTPNGKWMLPKLYHPS